MTIEYSNEKEFTKFVREFLLNKKMMFCGLKHGSGWENKKLVAQITHVDITKTRVKKGGRCDVMMYHDGLDLDYDHKLANPFKLELKTNLTWKDSLAQAIRYKVNAEKKYGNSKQHKLIEVGVSSPHLFHTGAFCPQYCPIINCKHDGGRYENMNDSNSKIIEHCGQFVIKRIFWKSGVALLEKCRYDDSIQITCNEGDKIKIK